MNDRPMKTISLRKFRDSIADIHEVVEVSRRTPEGNIHVLGFWTPYMQDVPGSVELIATALVKDPLPGYEVKRVDIPVEDDPPVPNVIKTPEEAAAAVRPVRPFTKADQAGRKRK